MNIIKIFCAAFLMIACNWASAVANQNALIEQEARAFFDRYLATYNNRFGHPDRSDQFRQQLGELVQIPLLQAPPMSAPLVPDSLDTFTRNFEGFVTMLEGKNVVKLEWQQVEIQVLTPNKVLANNIGFGFTADGEVAYETISLYLLYRNGDNWKIAMFSPYQMDNAIHLERNPSTR
ncbi:MAG: hypothetical protein AB8B96_12345 [Lysobacterales bacterium]